MVIKPVTFTNVVVEYVELQVDPPKTQLNGKLIRAQLTIPSMHCKHWIHGT